MKMFISSVLSNFWCLSQVLLLVHRIEKTEFMPGLGSTCSGSLSNTSGAKHFKITVIIMVCFFVQSEIMAPVEENITHTGVDLHSLAMDSHCIQTVSQN